MISIYEITGQMDSLIGLFENGEIDEQTLNDTMESLNADLSAKVDGYGKYIASLNAEIAGYDAEIDRMEERKKRISAIIERLKVNLHEALQAAGKQKIKGTLFTASICKNPHSVSIVDENIIPLEYCTCPEPKPNKTLIKEALKIGKEVPGAELQQTEGVRIK